MKDEECKNYIHTYKCSLEDCTGCSQRFSKFEKEMNRLASTYGITDTHAGCYMCNYEDKFICHEYNNGCESVDKCKEIFEKESEKMRVLQE